MRRTTLHLAMLLAGALSGAAHAIDVDPGETLSPVPFESYPGGGEVVYTTSRTFSYNTGGFPGQSVTGTVDIQVIRLVDRRLVFRYTGSATGVGGIALYGFTPDGFSGFTTDIAQQSGFGSLYNPSEIIRSGDGDDVEIRFYSEQLIPGRTGRPINIITNATAYDLGGSLAAEIGPDDRLARGVPRPTLDTTPPVVEVTSPTPFGCASGIVPIQGSAADDEGLDEYVVEWSTHPSGPWTLIAAQSTPVVNGLLADWDTAGVPHGHTFLRVTGTNFSGQQYSYTTTVFIDQAFALAELRAPVMGAILGGTVCLDGSAWDQCFAHYTLEVADDSLGPFTPIDPGASQYNDAVLNDPLGQWETAGLPDGDYVLKLAGFDSNGHSAESLTSVRIDNTPPIALLSSPATCDRVDGIVPIIGTVSDANLRSWVVQIAPNESDGWTTIASGDTPVINGTLAMWDTTSLPACAYAIRVVATDESRVNCTGFVQQREAVRTVEVGCPADVNADGVGSIQDLLQFLTYFFAGCDE